MVITSDNVYHATMHYMEWRDYSFLFAFPSLAIRAFFIGTTNTKILTANSTVMPTCRRVIHLNYAIGIPLILLAFIFSDNLLGLFTNETVVIQTAFYPFYVMLSTFVISVPAYTYCNTVIGTGNTKVAFLFQVINITGYLLYLFLLSSSPTIPLAILNEGLREMVIVPLIGTKYALPLGILLCLLIVVLCYIFIPRIGQGTKKSYLTIGLIWIVLTVLFEFGLGVIHGRHRCGTD